MLIRIYRDTTKLNVVSSFNATSTIELVFR